MRWVRAASCLCAGAMLCALVVSCSTLLGLDEKPLAAADGGQPQKDAGHDTARPCTPDDAGYHDLNERGCWQTYEVPLGFDVNASYAGGAYDGRYLYFVSTATGLVVRYDSQSSFSSASGWSKYDTTQLQGGTVGSYAGVVFDGRYAYFVPSGDTPVFLRYDTHAEFGTAGSWSSFTLNPSDQVAYQGGTFDGRYLYFAPDVYSFNDAEAGGSGSGVVARYDTTLSFTSSASWSTFDTATLPGALNGLEGGFYGAVFDGKYAYFVPGLQSALVIVRLDTTLDFKLASSWEAFSLGLSSKVTGFATGMFDGKYVYLVPVWESAVAMRYDPSTPFVEASSWQQFAPAPGSGAIGNGATPFFGAGGFDGRRLYFVPAPDLDGPGNGLISAYDSLPGTFEQAKNWSSFDTLSLKAVDFGGAVFDGQFLYLAPNGGATFARFNAKEMPAQPKLPSYFGSFF